MKYLLVMLKMIVLTAITLILFKSFGVSDWRPWTIYIMVWMSVWFTYMEEWMD